MNGVDIVELPKGQRMALTVWKPQKELHRQGQISVRE